MKRVLYLQREEILPVHKPKVEAFFQGKAPGVSVRFSDGTSSVEDAIAEWIIAPAASWTEEPIRRAVKATWVHFQGSGTDQIAAFMASRPDLRFTTSQGVNADAIAEYIVGALLYFAKDFDHFSAAQARGRWDRRWLHELTGTTVVILGTGQIGRSAARRLRPFGVRILGLSRSGGAVAEFDEVHPAAALDEVIGNADALVIAVPLTDETAGAVGLSQLQRLPDRAVLINVARGGVVDEFAVRQQLFANKLRGAAFDVFEIEPLPESSLLWTTPRLILTPHVAGTTQFYVERMLATFLAEIPAEEVGPAMEF